MNIKTLYLHGFNSGPGGKVQQLRDAGFEVISPQLPYDPARAVDLIGKVAEKYADSELYVVGTSLGGFYAMLLSLKYPQFHYYLVNPSIRPEITLKRFLSQTVKNYKTSEQFHVSAEFISALKRLSEKLDHHLSAEVVMLYSVFLGENDDVLNSRDTELKFLSYQCPVSIFRTDQNHRFSDISIVIERIIEDAALLD